MLNDCATRLKIFIKKIGNIAWEMSLAVSNLVEKCNTNDFRASLLKVSVFRTFPRQSQGAHKKYTNIRKLLKERCRC